MPEAKRKEMNSPASLVSEGENLTSCHCLMCQYRIVISTTVCGSRERVCLPRSPALRSLGSFWTLSLQAGLNLESAQVDNSSWCLQAQRRPLTGTLGEVFFFPP